MYIYFEWPFGHKSNMLIFNSFVILWLEISFQLDIKKQKENNVTTWLRGY